MDRDYYRKNRNVGLCLGTVSLVVFYIVIIAGGRVGWDLGLGFAAALIGVASMGFFITACYCWAKYKNRSGWLALWGFLAPLGLIPPALMKDETKS